MAFRKSEKKDIPQMMAIIKQAQAYLKKQGIDQWQNKYPNEAVLGIDIEKGESYVLTEHDKVLATTVVSFQGEKNYECIFDGAWQSKGHYGVIHRIAVDEHYKGMGLGSRIMQFAKELCHCQGVQSIRVDTHEENLPMQKLLQKNDFQYCGIIYLESGDKRLAFEKVIS